MDLRPCVSLPRRHHSQQTGFNHMTQGGAASLPITTSNVLQKVASYFLQRHLFLIALRFARQHLKKSPGVTMGESNQECTSDTQQVPELPDLVWHLILEQVRIPTNTHNIKTNSIISSPKAISPPCAPYQPHRAGYTCSPSPFSTRRYPSTTANSIPACSSVSPNPAPRSPDSSKKSPSNTATG